MDETRHLVSDFAEDGGERALPHLDDDEAALSAAMTWEERYFDFLARNLLERRWQRVCLVERLERIEERLARIEGVVGGGE